jgi:hypothetical protein
MLIKNKRDRKEATIHTLPKAETLWRDRSLAPAKPHRDQTHILTSWKELGREGEVSSRYLEGTPGLR